MIFSTLFGANLKVDPIHHQLSLYGSIPLTKGVEPIRFPYTDHGFFLHNKLQVNADLTVVEFLGPEGSPFRFMRKHKSHAFKMDPKTLEMTVLTGIDEPHLGLIQVECKRHSEVKISLPNGVKRTYTLDKQLNESYFNCKRFYQLLLREEVLESGLVQIYSYENSILSKIQLYNPDQSILIDEVLSKTEKQTTFFLAYGQEVARYNLFTGGYELYQKGLLSENFKNPTDTTRGFFVDAKGEWTGFEQFAGSIVRKWTKDSKGRDFLVETYHKNIFPSVNLTVSTEGTTSIYAHENNRVERTFKITNSEYHLLWKEIEERFDKLSYMTPKKAFLDLCLKRGFDSKLYFYAYKAPFLSKVMQFCKNRLARVDVYHFRDLMLTQLRRFVDHSWGKTPSLEYDGNKGFFSKDQESEIVDFYYQNKDGLHLLTHKKTANGISETHHYRDTGQRILSELALKGKTIRAKTNRYNDLGLVECVVDYDPNTSIQKELWTTYNSFGQVLEQSQKSPTQHLITTTFSYDERRNIRTKTIYNGENRLIEVIEYHYDPFDRLILEKSSLGTGLELQYNDQNTISLKKDLETGLETTFVYDSQGQLIETDTLRGSERIVLDPFKRPIERIDIHNAKTIQKWGEGNKLLEVCLSQYNGPRQSICYHYDALGYVKEEVDPDGNTIRYRNDLLGNKKEVMIGPYTSFYEYNSQGKLTRQKIENQDIQEDILDPLGRVVRSVSSQKTTSFTYNGFDVVQKKCSDGTIIDYTYDDAGRLIEEVTRNGPFSSTKKTTYDPNGRPTHIEFLEKGQHIFRFFDDRGRLVEERVEDSLQRVENHKKWTWGASDLLLIFEELVDGMWAKTVKNYDSVGREISLIDPMGQKTLTTYNDHFINGDHQEVVQIRKEFSNQMVEVTTLDPFGRSHIVELFDSFKNLVKKDRYTRDFKGQVLTHTVDYQITTGMDSYQNAFKYDTSGKLIQKIKNAQSNHPQVFSYKYDSKGRLISLEKPDRVILTYAYNSLGDIVHQKSSDDTVDYQYSYDEDRRLVRVFNCLSQSYTDLKYSSDGLLVEERLENGQSIAMGYNPNAELSSFSSEIFGKVEYGYGSFGVESVCYEYQNQTYPFQLTKTQGKGLLKKIAYPENSPSTTFDYNCSAQSIRKVHFGGYDYIAKFNSMGSATKRWLKDFSGKTQLRYKYDGLDRLEKGSDEKEARTYNGLGILSFLGDKTILTDSRLKIKKVGSTLFQYDPQGNRSLKKDLEAETRYTFDALDRLTKIQTRSNTITLQYDFKNRLISKKIVQEGIEEQVDYLYLGDVEIGSIATKTKELVDFRVVFQEPNKRSTHTLLALVQNRPVFVATDIFKNITSLIDPAENAPLAHVRFDAFGNQTTSRGDFGLMSWMYQGKRWHPEFGLYQFEHRFYDPGLAVFISCDPDGDKNGVDECRYALNNPLKYEDFGGLYPIDFSISIDFSSPVHRLLNLAYEGRDFTLNDFLSGLTLQTALPLDTFCSTLKNTGSHLAKYLTNLIQKDRTRFENSASKNSSSLLLGPLDIDPIPPSYQFHPMIHRVTPDTKSRFNSDGFIDIFMNGIWNSMDDAAKASKAIANFLQKDVVLVYNPTFGYFKDLFRAIGNKRSMKKGNAADLLYQITNHVMDLSSKDVRIWAHSEGAMNTRIAFEEFPEAKRDRLTIFTFGGGELVPNNYGRQVVNFISDCDTVALNANAHILSYHSKEIKGLPLLSNSTATFLMFWDKKKTHIDHKYNVTVLKSEKFFDHYFLGDTYQSALGLAVGS